jgi:YD repeat-containing protein
MLRPIIVRLPRRAKAGRRSALASTPFLLALLAAACFGRGNSEKAGSLQQTIGKGFAAAAGLDTLSDTAKKILENCGDLALGVPTMNEACGADPPKDPPCRSGDENCAKQCYVVRPIADYQKFEMCGRDAPYSWYHHGGEDFNGTGSPYVATAVCGTSSASVVLTDWPQCARPQHDVAGPPYDGIPTCGEDLPEEVFDRSATRIDDYIFQYCTTPPAVSKVRTRDELRELEKTRVKGKKYECGKMYSTPFVSWCAAHGGFVDDEERNLSINTFCGPCLDQVTPPNNKDSKPFANSQPGGMTGGAGPNAPAAGEPVSLESGAFFTMEESFLVARLGPLALSASTYYSSDNQYTGHTTGALAPGWALPYQRTMVYSPPPPPNCPTPTTCTGVPPGTLTYIGEYGEQYTFERTSSMDGDVWTYQPKIKRLFGSVVRAELDLTRYPSDPDSVHMRVIYADGSRDEFTGPRNFVPEGPGRFGAMEGYGPMRGVLISARDKIGNHVDVKWDLVRNCNEDGTACWQETLTLVAADGAVRGALERFYTQIPIYNDPESATVVGRHEMRLAEIRDAAINYAGADGAAPRVMRFAYDALGRVASITDPDGHAVEYGYDNRGRLTKRCDENQAALDQKECLENEYDGWRVVKQHEAGDTVLTFNWYDSPIGEEDEKYDLEVVVGPDAGSAKSGTRFKRYLHNRNGQILRAYRSNTTKSYASFEYEPIFGWVVRETDPSGVSTKYTRDERGITKIEQLCKPGTEQTCVPLVTEFTLRPDGGIAAMKTPDNVQVVYDYRANAVLPHAMRRVAAGGTLPEQRWEFEYGGGGEVVATRHPDGTWETVTLDARGRPAAVTVDARGAAPLALRATTTFDWRGHLVAATDFSGRAQRFAYTPSGRVELAEEPGPRGGRVVTRYTYDPVGNVIEVTEDVTGNPRTTKFTYEPLGEDGDYTVVRVEDALGHRVEREFDAAGRLMAVVTKREAPNADRVTRYWYNTGPGGDWLWAIDAPFDESGHQVRVETREVSPSGELAAVIDGRGVRTEFTYDGLGRLSTKKVGTAPVGGDPLNALYGWSYDAAGRLAVVYGPNGPVSSFDYDGFGRLVASRGPEGHASTLEYDARDRVVLSYLRPLGTSERRGTTRIEYDAAGRVVAEIADPLEKARRTEYRYGFPGTADLWSLASIKTPSGTTSYAYDAAGNLAQVTDADGGVFVRDFDRFRRPTRVVDALGATTAFEYDAIDRTKSEVRRAGDIVLRWTYGYAPDVSDSVATSMTDPAGRTTRYAYDPMLRPKAIAYPQGNNATPTAPSVTYDYYENGLLRRATSSVGSIAFEFDAANRLSRTIKDNSEVVAYAYDKGDRLTASTVSIDFNEVSSGYRWGAGASGHLAAMRPFGAAETTFEMTPEGLPTRVVRPGAMVTTKTWDPQVFEPTSLEHKGAGGAVLSAFGYGYDGSGNRNSFTTLGGDSWRIEHDALDRIKSVRIGSAAPATYGYDAIGNWVQTNGVEAFRYDEIGERIVNGGSFQYDANGNLLFDGETRFTYDTANRLVRSQNDGAKRRVESTFDALGALVAQKTLVDGEVASDVRLTLDYGSALPFIRTVRDLKDGTVQHYAWGPEGPIARTAAGGVQYAMLDALGSVRGWAQDGAVVERQDFDVWGNRTTATGGSNLTNGGFEIEDSLTYGLGKWFFLTPGLSDPALSQSSAAYVDGGRSGSKAMRVTFDGRGFFAAVQQDPVPPLEAGRTYRIRAWVRGANGGEGFKIRIQQCCNPFAIHRDVDGLATRGTWSLQEFDVTIPSTARGGLSILLASTTANGTVFFDDVEVLRR